MKTIILSAAFFFAGLSIAAAQTTQTKTPQHKSKIGKKKNVKMKQALAKKQAVVLTNKGK